MLVELPIIAVAAAKVRDALALYETAMDPKVREIGKKKWGQHIPEGTTPAYLHQFKQCVGYSMRNFIIEGKEMDAYTLGAIIMSHLRVFLPDNIRADDSASERHR